MMILFKITRHAFVLPDGSELLEFVKEHKFDAFEQALLMTECYGYAIGAWTKKYGQAPKIEIDTPQISKSRVPEMFDRLLEAADSSRVHFKDEDVDCWAERIL